MNTPGRWFFYVFNIDVKKILSLNFGNLAYFYKLCYYKEELFLFGVKDSIRLNFSS